MKKFRVLTLFVALASLLIIQSCSESEKIEPAATVALDAATGQNIPGAAVTIKATVTAPNGGKSLDVYVGGAQVESFPIAGAKDFTKDYVYTIPASAVVGSSIIISFQAVDNKNFPSTIANFTLTVGSPIVELTGTLATRTLVKGTPYLIKGTVLVPNGVTLTINAGAIIKGDKATKGLLIIQPGGILLSNGTATEPVVFTSSQGPGERDRGDWGGISWTGNAFVNQTARPNAEGIANQPYGTVGAGNMDAGLTENNGTMTYTRIEYAGIELTPNNETNSLTMGALGGATVIDRVQVSFGGDDGFEWFGGMVNGKRLVSLSTWDDDFDSDFGWRGNVQWGIVVRNVSSADQSGSNAFESDNQGNGNTIAGVCDGTEKKGCTSGVFSNITVLGPRDIQSRGISNNYDNAIHIRRRTNISIFNSFFSGWRKGLRIDDQGTLDNLTSGSAVHQYNVLAVPYTPSSNVPAIATSPLATDAAFITNIEVSPATNPVSYVSPAIENYWVTNNNTYFTTIPDASKITNLGVASALYWGASTAATYPSNPSFILAAGEAANTSNLNGTANFTNAKMGAFFDKTITYRGGFGATDWTDGWTEFQPSSKVY
jgi:hypothetical protein